MNVATPEAKVPEVPPAAMEPPVPEAIAAVAVPELTEVTTLPPESSTLTTGWVPRARPSSRWSRARCVMTSWVAAPVASEKVGLEVAEVSPLEAAVRL